MKDYVPTIVFKPLAQPFSKRCISLVRKKNIKHHICRCKLFVKCSDVFFFSHFTIIRIKSWLDVVCPERDAVRVEALAAHSAEEEVAVAEVQQRRCTS
jgi:hypothetical protein